MSPTKTDSNTERMMNLGREVELKFLGKVKVKELSLGDTLECVSDLVFLIEHFQDFDKEDSLKQIATIVKRPEIKAALCKVAAKSMDADEDVLEKMPLSDWLKWFKAFKDVIDWEELKELFFEIVPKESFLSKKKE